MLAQLDRNYQHLANTYWCVCCLKRETCFRSIESAEVYDNVDKIFLIIA